MSPHSTPLAPPPSGAFFVPEYPNRVDRYSPPWQNGHARDNNPLWLRAPARPRDSSGFSFPPPKPTRCSTGAWRQPSDVPERHADEPRGAIERSSPFLRSWLFRKPGPTRKRRGRSQKMAAPWITDRARGKGNGRPAASTMRQVPVGSCGRRGGSKKRTPGLARAAPRLSRVTRR
jgi:hypothetical protein